MTRLSLLGMLQIYVTDLNVYTNFLPWIKKHSIVTNAKTVSETLGSSFSIAIASSALIASRSKGKVKATAESVGSLHQGNSSIPGIEIV